MVIKATAAVFLFFVVTAAGAAFDDETSSTTAVSAVEKAGIIGPTYCITSPCPGPLASVVKGSESTHQADLDGVIEDEMPVPWKTVIAEQDVLAHHLDEDTGCGCIRPCLLAEVSDEFEAPDGDVLLAWTLKIKADVDIVIA